MYNRKIIKYLEEWKNKSHRKPLVVRGARQVGKTSAILIFAKKNFKNLIHLNLEDPEHLRPFKKELSLKEFLDVLKLKFKKTISPKVPTLIFIDEIQNSPSLIKLLRFLYEERPDIFVIAAGSLLEAKIEKEGFSFPVGRVEFCYLYPLDFFEYLEAKGENELLRELKKTTPRDKIPDVVHELALENFYEYTMIGGMPEIVAEYIKEKDFNQIRNIYASILTGYMEDVFKYSSQAEAKYLSYIIENAPLFAGTHITYEKFGGSNFRSREMSRAFSLLEKIMLLTQIRATNSRNIPLFKKEKRPKKLIYLDVGLVNYRMNILNNYLNLKDFDHFYQGRIAEQITAQNLLASFMDVPTEIFYWARNRKEGMAEVDFCLNFKGNIIAIEVKSGKLGKLKSLAILNEQIPDSTLIRIYSGRLKNERRDKKNLLSVPFYLIPQLFKML